MSNDGFNANLIQISAATSLTVWPFISMHSQFYS